MAGLSPSPCYWNFKPFNSRVDDIIAPPVVEKKYPMEKSVPVHHRSIWWYDQSSGLNSPFLAEVHILLSQGVDMIISLIHVFFWCSLMCSNTQNQHIIHLGFKDLSVSALIGVSLWSLFKSPYFQGPMRPITCPDRWGWTRFSTRLARLRDLIILQPMRPESFNLDQQG